MFIKNGNYKMNSKFYSIAFLSYYYTTTSELFIIKVHTVSELISFHGKQKLILVRSSQFLLPSLLLFSSNGLILQNDYNNVPIYSIL